MTAIQTQLDKATQAVKERLLGEFKLSDIPDIAEMINAIKTVQDYSQAFEGVPEESEAVEVVEEEAAPEGIDYLSHIQDELDGADQYFNYWLETKDESYRDMARDEVRHAEFFLSKARQELGESPEWKELKTYHNAILARLV